MAMKAYHFSSPEEGLQLVELADLTAGPGEVVIDAKAAGLCHSDVHIVNGPGGQGSISTRARSTRRGSRV